MLDQIRVICLGGLDEVYKNMTVVEINQEIFVIEAGIKFPDKTKPGIDYIIPNFDYLIQNKDKVRGYFLTHGDDTMIGAIPYICKRVNAPIYCTDITKVFLLSFCKHNNIDPSYLDIRLVEPSDDIEINGRKISFFSTCCSFARSLGISISTSQGNIIYISNNVIDNNNDVGFVIDIKKLSVIAEKDTLLLMSDSTYAERSGYTNPLNKLLPLIAKPIFDAQGRCFIALDATDQYNIINAINYAIKLGKKIIAYDKTTRELLANLIVAKQLSLTKENVASMEDVNRLRPQDLFIVITGFGTKLYSTIALIAANHSDYKFLRLNDSDTFIVAGHKNNENEVAYTDSINELYHNDCKIITFSEKEFIKSNSSEEDLKTILSLIKPKNYLPVSGTYTMLLANAKIALNMNIGLNHTNVFILDNGGVLELTNQRGKLSEVKVNSGDCFVDGKGVGDVMSSVIEERQKFSDDGVVILALTISKKDRKIVAGPDVQTRGLLFVKESDSLLKEINRLFINCVESEITKEHYSIAAIEISVKDTVLRAIRRTMLKTPIIIPIIAEIE